MSVFSRMKAMTRASVNEWLDKVENPVIMLNQYIRDMEGEISRAQTMVARQIGNVRRLELQLEDAICKISEKEASASAALKNGQEETARQELEEKVYYEGKADQYAELYQQAKAQADKLSRQLEDMKAEYTQMCGKRSEFANRAQLARSKKGMASAVSSHGIEGGSASRGFQQMEEKIMQLEVEAEIAGDRYQRVKPTSPSGTDPERARLVEEQLQALKSKLEA